MAKSIFILSLFMIMPLILGACQSPAQTVSQKVSEKVVEKTIENATGGQANVDINNNNVNVKTKEGNLNVGENVSLPADFPKDVYVYEGKITAAISSNESKGYTVSIESDKSVAEIKAAYEKKIVEDGWEKTGVMDIGNSVSIGGKKGNRALSVMISNSDNKTMIVLGVYEENNK
jgi:hypothetical protein